MTLAAEAISIIGPEDNGKRMSLREFLPIQTREGSNYELSRGVIEVSDVPSILHASIVDVIQGLLYAFRAAHPDSRLRHFTGGDHKIVVPATESERHPDLSIYLTPPPPGPQPWASWVPGIVIEVSSETSSQRDHVDKAEDYFEAGVKEYWIVDPATRRTRIHRRSDVGWNTQTLKGDVVYRSPLLPEFEINFEAVLAKAEAQSAG